MTADEIKAGRTYAGRGPHRYVTWISSARDRVQYDSDKVGLGRRYPMVSMERFAKWAQREVLEHTHDR